jgi:transcriptional regulator with XRE-family HTH domain
MELEFEKLAQNLAHQLVEIRQKRSLTQESFAKLVGLPRSTIANLESGQGNPSLVNLAKMAAALGMTIEQLLHPPRAICTHIKEKDIPKFERNNGLVKILKLLPDSLPHSEIDRIEISPGGLMKGIPHSSGTKEYFYCLTGEIRIQVFNDSFHLKKGDILAFPGEARHSYHNETQLVTSGLSVVILTPLGL